MRFQRKIALLSAGFLLLFSSGVPSSSAEAPYNRSYYETRGEVVWEVPGNEKLVALTFDDGPDPEDTPRILDILNRHGARATFFVMGKKAREHPEIVQREAREGHEVANHTFSHLVLGRSVPASRIREEIVATQEAIAEATGRTSHLFRPPEGVFDPHVLEVIKREGLQTVMWSWHQDTHDWSRPGADRIVGTVLGHVRNGDIVLMHDFVYGPSQTVEALSRILPQLKKEGFRFITVSELLGHSRAVGKNND
ncbi:polysaccharide deacetylase family protein [Cohnella massiliensis]|uniref:polysaccharide deacetylase family protein n=1 Tax=Cohnella massiliensis TaxID=1816691 RepID=UPI0009B97176|nr:polysaccharide deacetylase family protein [Cohnella massiliensis]